MREDGHMPARDPDTGQIVSAVDFEPTPKQRKFIALLANGAGPVAAARAAGYQSPNSEATRLRKSPAVRAKMREIRELRFDQLASLSLRRLGDLIADPDTPSTTLLAAIIHVHNVTGHTKPKDKDNAEDNTRDVRELSLADLEAIVRQRLGNARVVGEGKTVDQAPEAGETEGGVM